MPLSAAAEAPSSAGAPTAPVAATPFAARLAGAAVVLGAMLVLLAAKLWLIGTYGNATPFWDQWDAEGALLFDPWLRGDLQWGELFSAHNEHRILFTRLLALLLFSLNGLWNPILEAVANAFLHVGALALLTVLAWRSAGKGSLPFLAGLALCVFLLPHGYENTLFGFQSQFYFVLAFSFGALWLLATARVFGGGWWAGLALACMACFSLASGIFAFAAAGALLLVRGLRREDQRELLAAVVLLVLFLVSARFVPSVEQHAVFRAGSVGQFASALLQGLAWPFQSPALALVRNAPVLVFLPWMVRSGAGLRDPRWFLFALALWCLGQEATLAFGRAYDVLASRYIDLHAVLLFANGAALVTLVLAARRHAGAAFAAAAAWVALVAIALAQGVAGGELPAKLERAWNNMTRQQANLQAYVKDGDRAKLVALPFMHLPYPDGRRLESILDSPHLRGILPSHLQPALVPAAASANGGFASPGVPPSVPPCDCQSLGSFAAGGNGFMGEARVAYDMRLPAARGGRVTLLVAGYPTRGGGIELHQAGRVERLAFASDPGDRWERVWLAVDPGPFELRIGDASPGGWVAAGAPVPAGRLDEGVEGLLRAWPTLLLLGLALLAFAPLLAWYRGPGPGSGASPKPGTAAA